MELTLMDSEPSRLGETVVSRSRKMVLPLMAGHTECDQIAQVIVTKFAPLRQMMYVQIFRRTAILTAPSISFEHSMAK